jgi:putative FmdB family regulatory protein
MPIYEYQCSRCEHVFEELILRASDEAELACPSCQQDEPVRILSAAAVSSGGGDVGGGCVPRGGFS